MNRVLLALLALVSASGSAIAEDLQGILYKNPNCQCCESHAEYLRKNGIEVDVIPASNLEEMSTQAGVPANLQGCHMIKLDGYVFEGHITAEIIKRFLAEKPAGVVGLTIPGMPSGVPGMPGEKAGSYAVYAIHKDGTTTTYAAQ
jgi:hypothetical protein